MLALQQDGRDEPQSQRRAVGLHLREHVLGEGGRRREGLQCPRA
ncbi:hypothetical protein V3W47_18620 [Deinococcus sp. YIM 134068]